MKKIILFLYIFSYFSFFNIKACGLALIRLRKPLSYYRDTYGDPAWGLRMLYLLMEKQRNRGQDGAGLVTVKFDMPPGQKYVNRVRSAKRNAIPRIFDTVMKDLSTLDYQYLPSITDDELKQQHAFLGELYLGHIRYGTHSGNDVTLCQPYLCKNSVAAKSFALAGNFNMTNTKERFDQLIRRGVTPTSTSDTDIIREEINYYLSKIGIDVASGEIDLAQVLNKTSSSWDGGYVLACLMGNGDAFVCRDPAGIRPGYFYINEEVVACASEQAALVTVFDVLPEDVQPIKPGHMLIIKRHGHIEERQFTPLLPLQQCVFERIYFSRGSDPAIYQERKALGRNLAPRVLEALGDDIAHAVFSYIPNTGQAALIGMLEEIDRILQQRYTDILWQKIQAGIIKLEDIHTAYEMRLRAELLVYKDQVMRTFITHNKARDSLVSRIYDVTKGAVQPGDVLVVMDDSIVRGNTLSKSIMQQLIRLNPKRIIIVSSCPPIVYPDCYGIDMSQIGSFIAFQAVVAILKERGEELLLKEVEQKCLAQYNNDPAVMVNYVKEIYEQCTLEELSAQIAQLALSDSQWDGKVEIIYQTIEGLHKAIPDYTGDWYFTGDYPTPGGYKVLNQSYINWYQGRGAIRAY